MAIVLAGCATPAAQVAPAVPTPPAIARQAPQPAVAEPPAPDTSADDGSSARRYFRSLAPRARDGALGAPYAPEFSLTRDPLQDLSEDLQDLPTIDLITPPTDLWQRLRNGFAMPDLSSPLVAERQAWYLNRPQMLKQLFERSRRYIYYIVGELEKRGMPTELALLPVIESAYNPKAYSSARASGIWQFIPSTGKNYQLEQNWWLDERRDIIASTGAALEYLQTIYEMNGDWHLALASYNWGENAVARAVAKNQARGLPTDYANLTMPAETRYYVPKLQAIKNIVADPETFGIRLDPIANEPYFDTVPRPMTMDVSLAAKLAETPLDEFVALNPSYNRPVMPGSKSNPMLLPADKIDTFLANLALHEDQDKPLSNWHTHTLKRGEKLEKVAARYGVSTARLRQLNGITRRNRVVVGQTLLVPRKGSPAAADLRAARVQPAEAPRAKKGKPKGKRTAKARKRKSSAGKAVKAKARRPAKAAKAARHVPAKATKPTAAKRAKAKKPAAKPAQK